MPTAQFSKDTNGPKKIVKILLRTEQRAVRGYTEISPMTIGEDHQTYGLTLTAVHEEIEHDACFYRISWSRSLRAFPKTIRNKQPFVATFLQ
ncbi:MAG: hypothetical protein QXX20_06075 [Candidatus Thermoplasmatota archaeon]